MHRDFGYGDILQGDEIGDKKKGKVMTDERMRMIDEENRAVARKKKVLYHPLHY